MPVIHDRISVAAATTVRNVLQGSVFEFLKTPSKIQIGAVASAVGVFGKLTIGDTVAAERFPVRVEAVAGGGVRIPDDMTIEEAGLGGDRLSLEFTNTTAGALTVEFYVRTV